MSQPPKHPKKNTTGVPQSKRNLEPSGLDFPVVGIGASAGGIPALLRFFENMPHDNGMAFVIILHLSATHESDAAVILQRVTKMPVVQVTQPVPIHKNQVYVISPAQFLSMDDDHLCVSPRDSSAKIPVAIDLFFRDLAEVHKTRAFCLILSGTGADGAAGVARIKEQGGVSIAQSPDDAEYADMPLNAIATGMVDLVLPVVEIPHKLIELWRNARNIHMPTLEHSALQARRQANEEEAKAAEDALRDILGQLLTRTGHNFRHYKRATVLRRIERRMQVRAQSDLASYLQLLKEQPDETKALLDDMLIGVTNFFRDREAFEALERDIIPSILQRRDAGTAEHGNIRVWSAGSSTGEEAYSLAMLFHDQQQLDSDDRELQVFATDIDERAIAVGRTGTYTEAIITDVPPSRLRQYFTKEQRHYKVKKEIREKILFAQHSLLRDPPFSQVDLISCRNLLIYLDREAQRKILEMFHFALRPGGFLFLGNSESADVCGELFDPIDKKNRIYRAVRGPVSGRQIPVLPSGAGRETPTPQPSREANARRQSFAEIHQRVLEQYAPPSLIVTPGAEIVHMSDRAGHFLRYVGGEPSHNLLSLVRPELRLELRTALFQANQSGKSVEARRVKIMRGERAFYVNMVTRPFRNGPDGKEFVLVLFDEVEGTLRREAEEPADETKDSVLTQLEEELQRTKLQLQNTLEQSGTSNEELKASNEELQAINEELRSATEELETSKEELQSINEELTTVNFELKCKVEETGKINDDLQNLITSTDIATIFVDRGMRIKWFTPRATDIFSMRSVDSGRPLLDITHRLDYDDLAKDAARVFETLSLAEREVRSHDNRWYIARLLPYRTSEDHIEGAVFTFIDITDRRAAEEELRLGEERMRLVAESTQDYAIIVQDVDGTITSWNQGAELIFGYTKQEAVGQHGSLIFIPEDRSAGVPEEELQRARDNGRAEDERWHMRKNGTRFYCSGVVNPLDHEGFRGYVKIARDLTERQQQQVARERELAETQNTIQLRDEFFAVMSHELKHPLNLIQLNAKLLDRLKLTKNSPVASKAVATIHEAVTSQAKIIDDLLDVSRVRTGKLKLQRREVDVGPLITEIVKVVKADERGRTFELNMEAANSEPLIIDADPVRVEQIIWNLLNNALKFSADADPITINVFREENCAKVEVIDRGQGIAAEHLDRVFDLFGQVETQHTRLHRGGLGIGLSLVRQLAEAHGGQVQVASPGEGQGSTFSVLLPLSLLQENRPALAQLETEGSRMKGLRVLLVDDSPEVLEVMQLLLDTEEAQVSSFASPLEALEVAKQREFDLIISDIGMPQMNGYDLMRALRNLPQLARTPAIALTGFGNTRDAERAHEAGFDLHLGKPVSYDALLEAVVRLHLERQSAD
ncbi:MAG: PAS domain S-box protein [Pseudomonas sp.]|nr:PAS domain S-box protein [Pseudomonas sp.]